MLRTDYIQRMIEQIAKMLASVMRLRSLFIFFLFAQGLDDTARLLFGLGIKLMLSMDMNSLISSLQEPEKILVLTRLLRIEAELADESGQGERSKRALMRALGLLQHVQGQDIELDDEAQQLFALAQQRLNTLV